MTLMFYLGSVALFGTGALCIRHTSPYTRAGGAVYEKRRTRKILGEILLVAGLLMLGMAIISQFLSSFE